jgi:hypothetical protein
MDIGSIFLILALTMITFLIISHPVLDKQTENTPLVRRQAARREEHHRSALLAERDRLLNALQELDNDHELGKLDSVDYHAQRSSLMTTGAGILKQLDEIEAAANSQRSSLPAAASGDAVEQMISERKRSRPEKAVGFCPKCGKPAQKSDQFCSRCGAELS